MRMMHLTVLAVLLLAMPAPRAAADTFNDRAKVEAAFVPDNAKPGQTVVYRMTMKIANGYHSYPTKQLNEAAADYVTSFRKPKFGEFVLVGEVKDPMTVPGMTDGHDAQWVTGSAVWEIRFVVHPKATPGKRTLQIKGTIPVCDEKNCLIGDPPPAELTITDAPAVSIDPQFKGEVEKFPLENPTPQPAVPRGPDPVTPTSIDGKSQKEIAAPADTLEQHEANLQAIREQLAPFEKTTTSRGSGGLWGFLFAALFWGGVALITPCVFPMIPITVSFFLHQSQHEHHRPLKMALIYCGTIIIVLSISAMALLTVFQALSVHPGTNLALGALFLFFAMSLFGLYEITLPSRLTSFTSSREGKGGVVGTVFMALTFTIVSFTCVAPFLGGFSGMAASGNFSKFELALGALVFSTTFAAPFFFLALFPSLIRKLPQSGSWLNSVKVVMGFLEIAAALKFFRTAELRLLDTPTYFTYDLVLAVWVALALISGLYLLNMFRLHHDEPIEHIGVVRMLLGAAFIGLALYLLPGMLKLGKGENQRPRGFVYAWVDAFLLPELTEDEMPWSVNLKGTIDLARKDLERSGKRQFVFLDYTGITCSNCKYNEKHIFSRADIRELLDQFRLVQHYTDQVPSSFYTQEFDDDRRVDEAKMNKRFQDEIFGTIQLPLYRVIEVTKDKLIVRGLYDEGKINDVGAFVKFLKDARKDDKKN